MSAGPGGTVNPSGGYFDSGTGVSIWARQIAVTVFANWAGTGTGSFSGTNNRRALRLTGQLRKQPVLFRTKFISTPQTTVLVKERGFAVVTVSRLGDISAATSVDLRRVTHRETE